MADNKNLYNGDKYLCRNIYSEMAKQPFFRGDLYQNLEDERKRIDEKICKYCKRETIRQIFMPRDTYDVCGVIYKNGLESACLNGIIFAFDDYMIEFNFGTFRILNKRLEDFPEIHEKEAEDWGDWLSRPLEYFVKLDYNNQVITDCGLNPQEKWGDEPGIYGWDVVFKLSNGKTICCCSGETITRIIQK